jgi:hypothetical protein
VIRDGRSVSSGALSLPAPDELGAIRHVSSVPLERLREGRYEVRVRVTQEGRSVEQTTALEMRPAVGSTAGAALRVVEKVEVEWPESDATHRVLLDVKEEKVALGLVKPPAPRRKGWARKGIALAGLAGLGATGLVLAHDTPPLLAVWPPEGIASATVFSFEVIGGCGGACVWEFGDGKSRTGPSVTHVYEETGIYEVRLLVNGRQKGRQLVLVNTLSSGGWRLRTHSIALSQSGSEVVAECHDHPQLDVRWECRWEGSIKAPNTITMRGPWVVHDRGTGTVDARPSVVVEGTLVSRDQILLSIDGAGSEPMSCCSFW